MQGISQFGIWIYVGDTEYFLSYDDFPWFKTARVSEIMNLKLVHEDHLEWPDLVGFSKTTALETRQTINESGKNEFSFSFGTRHRFDDHQPNDR